MFGGAAPACPLLVETAGQAAVEILPCRSWRHRSAAPAPGSIPVLPVSAAGSQSSGTVVQPVRARPVTAELRVEPVSPFWLFEPLSSGENVVVTGAGTPWLPSPTRHAVISARPEPLFSTAVSPPSRRCVPACGIEDPTRNAQAGIHTPNILDVSWLGLGLDGEPVIQSEQIEAHCAAICPVLLARRPTPNYRCFMSEAD